MGSEFLKSLVIVFGTSSFVVFLLHRLRIPSLVGFLIAGVIIGPHGIGIIKDTHAVEIFAEIGVILLLFTIGIEFSISQLVRMKKAVIGGGSIQVLLTIILSAFASYLVTGNFNKSIFFGFLIALSSTAIVFKILFEKGEIDSPHGRMMVGILIFQDLCVVPLMLLTPTLAGETIHIMDFLIKIGKAVIIVTTVILSARWLVPLIFHQIVHTKSRELFMSTLILFCIGIAYLTSKFGLSLALGAFLAGLIISESEYAHQATSDILPFRDSFIGLFFVSVGMLIDMGFMISHYTKIIIAVFAIFGLKTVTGIIAAMFAGTHLRIAIYTGLGLAHIGEFSFVLAVAGKSVGLLSDQIYQIFLSSSVITMTLTPFILKAAPSVSAWIASRHLLKKISSRKISRTAEGFPGKKLDHVIIVGFGLNGRNLASVLREAQIPYVALEMNNDTVRELKKKGEPIFYGDGTSKEILHRLNIERARLLVIAISDPASTRRIIAIARKENPDIYIIVRTRYLSEVDDLKKLGADEVIPEEFETSIEIFSRVLNRYNFPASSILDMIEKIRSNNYTVLRSIGASNKTIFEKFGELSELDIDSYKISGASNLEGKSIAELQVRKKTGATIIAVKRQSEVYTNPPPEFRFKTGDNIIFTGARKDIHNALHYFRTGGI